MPIYQYGQLNTTALTAPGVYEQVMPPQTRAINGVASNILGFVGVASWGPVNTPQIVGSPQDQTTVLGQPNVRNYDLSTAVAVALQLGQNNIRTVRVTDGTDAAATVTLQDNGVAATGNIAFTTNPVAATTVTLGGTAVTFVASGATGNQVNIGGTLATTLASLLSFLQASADVNLVKFTYALNGNTLNLTAATTGTSGNSLTVATNVSGATASGATLTGGVAPATGLTVTALYTGTEGNKITAAMSVGTQASTYKLTINRPGYLSEVFDNISGSGATLWTNMASAVNNGQSGVRGPSQLITAAVASSTVVPNTTATYTLAGGLDGATSVTNSTLVGTDGVTRKGMYAMRGTGVQTLVLVDHTDTTAWGTMATFGANEGIFIAGQSAAGQTEAQTASSLSTAGADSPWLKTLIGDWVYWQDTYNGVQRLLGPGTFWGALRASLAPHQSTLNKPVLNLIGTQRSATGRVYSNAEVGQAATDRLDFIANPAPGGNYFAFQTDRNSSSDPTRNSEAYTTMTNYLALTLASAFGFVIGQPQTVDLRNQVRDSIQNFLSALWRAKMIGDPNNPSKPPFAVQINAANNPSSQVALGYMNAYVKVKYLSITRYFIISLEGGSSVAVQQSQTPLF